MSTSIEPATTAFEPTLAAARQAIYRFASLTVLDPRQGLHSSLADDLVQETAKAATEWLRNEPLAVVESLALGERSLAELRIEPVVSRLPLTSEALNQEYEATFGLLDAGDVPLCETDYIGAKFTFQRSHQMADVAGFYRAFGLDSSSQRAGRPDHIALELEFMAVLIDLERRAAEAGDSERFGVCRRAQERFVREHLAWWIPTWAALLDRLHPNGFYAAVGRLVSAFLPVERTLLGIGLPQPLGEPSRIESPEECDGCLLHATEFSEGVPDERRSES
jgi:TorA maturation chaperone TorD